VVLVLIAAIPLGITFMLGVAGVMALGSSGWRTIHMTSTQMFPSLRRGDRYLVNPYAYEGRQQPKRGDIIIFAILRGPSAGQQFAIRVVGLPGEEVAMRSGVPVIDGRSAVQEPAGDMTYGSITAARLRERLPDGTSYEIVKRGGVRQGDDGGPSVVPADSYFVLGDNRDDAVDSRYSREGSWTFIPRSALTGQAKYVYWSGFERLDRIGLALK
jgi:signal peptidase I